MLRFAAIAVALASMVLAGPPLSGGLQPGAPASAGEQVNGDVNCSGAVDAVDALQVLRSVAGLSTNAACMDDAGDVDCNGEINSVDALKILRYVAGFPLNTPPGCQPIGGEKPPSSALIDEALADGKISEDAAVLYKVYAAFGDSRLPAQYRGDDSKGADTEAAMLATARWESLSAQTQAALAPFLMPPSAPGSWLGLQTAAAGLRPVTNADTTWTEHSVLGGKVKVWSQDRYPEDGPKAEEIAEAVADTIWPQVTGLMGQGHAPLTDAPFPDNGGDGALDIYLVRLGAPGAGETVPYRKPSCRLEPAFINLDPTGPLGDETHAGALQGLEHEFFHTVQFTYDLEGCWQDYRWFLEASAQWSEDYVYPNAQSEHAAAGDLLDEPWTPLDEMGGDGFMHEYGAYLFPFYLARGLGSPELIPSIWEAYESTANSLQGVDTALQAHQGLGGVWPEFTLHNWNREPVEHYNDWDSLATGAVRAGAGPVNVSLSGESSKSFPVAAGVDYLSASYHHFVFDNSVRSIAFDNTLDGDSNAAVWALLKIGGEWREPADWTDEDSVTYCPADENERVEELVLIISNSDWQGKQTLNPDEQPRVVAGSFGCGTWTGTVTSYWRLTGTGTDISMSITASDVMFMLDPEGSSDDWWDYHAQSGTLNVTLDSGPGADCDKHGSGTVSVNPEEGYLRVSNLLLTPEGAEHSYTGNAMSGQSIPYNWSCPDGRHGVDTWPIAGWFFTGDRTLGDDPSVLEGEHVYTAVGWIQRWTWDLHAEP